jgi:hypothetical protein
LPAALVEAIGTLTEVAAVPAADRCGEVKAASTVFRIAA